MEWRGRELDPIALWSQYVDFPQSVSADKEFSPLVNCPNPDHYTRRNHFQVNLEKPLVHCFAHCGISGTYEHAIAMIEGITEKEARRVMMKHARISVGPRSRRKGNVHRKVESVAEDALEYERFMPPVGLEYLKSRGVDGGSIARFQLGWCVKTARLVIPAYDMHNTLRFLIKRAVNPRDMPKYLYTEGAVKERLLFGACTVDLKQVSSGTLVLVEGSIDAIKMQQYGIAAVAILGSKLSRDQLQIIHQLRPRKVVTMFDPDASGVHATRSAAMVLKVPHLVALYPRKGSDPGSLTREEAHHSVTTAVPWGKFFARLPQHARQRHHQEVNRYGNKKHPSRSV